MLFAGFVGAGIDIVSRWDVLRTQKVHHSVFVGKLLVVAEVMGHHGPEKEAEEEKYDGADKDWQPEVN